MRVIVSILFLAVAVAGTVFIAIKWPDIIEQYDGKYFPVIGDWIIPLVATVAGYVVFIIYNIKAITLYVTLGGRYVRRYIATTIRLAPVAARQPTEAKSIACTIEMAEKVNDELRNLLCRSDPNQTREVTNAFERYVDQEKKLVEFIAEKPALVSPVAELLTAGRSVSMAMATLMRSTDEDAQPILQAFLNRYMQEEEADISGKAHGSAKDKNIVVTNFVAYAQFVNAMIKKAVERAEERSKFVYCFTTLVMPVCKWFNFRRSGQQNDLHSRLYNDTDKNWDKYISDLRRLLGKLQAGNDFGAHPIQPLENKFRIRRCLLSVTDQLALENSHDPSFAFQTETQMRSSLKNLIVVPKKRGATDWNSIKAYSLDEIEILGRDQLNNLQDLLHIYGHVQEKAYLILYTDQPIQWPGSNGQFWKQIGPFWVSITHDQLRGQDQIEAVDVLKLESWEQSSMETIVSQVQQPRKAALVIPPLKPPQRRELFDVAQFSFEPVGTAFAKLFHLFREDALFRVLSNGEWDSNFGGDRNSPHRVPEDLFMIGFLDPRRLQDRPQWVCGLAADVDSKMDKLSLEFISSGSSPTRWQRIVEFVEELETSAVSLDRAMHA